MARVKAPTFSQLQKARKRIAESVHQTPVVTSELLNQLCNAQVFFKCENLQKTGSFKARGASNAVLGLTDQQAAAGVATYSTGNHGAALAHAAHLRGIHAHIVMPANAAPNKKQAVASYGGLVIECEPVQDAGLAALEALVQQTNAHVVPAFDDPRVIAGQATATMELMEQVPNLDVIVVPVGGGGLLAGTALAAKSSPSRIEVLAAEPVGADDAFRSLGTGELLPQGSSDKTTIADSLRANLGALNFEIIKDNVDTIVTVADATLIEAMWLQWTRLKAVVEPSGAASFAAVLEHPERFYGRRVGVIISGGNAGFNPPS